jgi:hypothetical protein
VATNCPSYPVEESQSRKTTGTLSAEPRRKNHPRKQGSEKYPSVLQLPLLGATTGTRNQFHWYSHPTWKGFLNTVTEKHGATDKKVLGNSWQADKFSKCNNGMGCVPNGGLKDTCIIVFVEVQIFSNPTVVQPTKEEC